MSSKTKSYHFISYRYLVAFIVPKLIAMHINLHIFLFKAPAKPSPYITNLIDPIRAFKVDIAKIVSEEQGLSWCLAISESISDK